MNAFTEIIDTYRDSLIFYLNRTLNNLSVSEDIAADSFAELMLHGNRYNKDKSSVKTYLFTIAHHKMVSYIRHASRYKMIPYEEAPQVSLEYQSFENELFKKAQNEILHNAMSKLGEEYRTVLHLVYFEDMTYEQVAKVMKKTKKQIDNYVYRGKKALRAILEKEGFEYEE